MDTGLKIKKLRKLRFLTQAQLAELSGVSDRTVRRLEANEEVEGATLLSILNALDTNLEELENMFNEDNTMKEESKEKFTDVSFLHRIDNGRELTRIIANAHQYGYDYHDCNSEEQIEMAQGFLSVVADVLDLWGMVEIGQRFELENELSKEIKLLEENGLWVFGTRQIDKENNNWITAIIEIYSKDNPSIQKIKMDKNVMQKKQIIL